MSFESIIKSIKKYNYLSFAHNCPVCDMRVYYNYVHKEAPGAEKHSLFYNSSQIEYFINPHTDLISFSKDHFDVVFYTEINHEFISEHKFDYSDIEDLEIKTIKEFVQKIKENLLFM